MTDLALPAVECKLSDACQYPPAIAVSVFCPQCDKWVIVYASTTLTACCLIHTRQVLTAPMESADRLNGIPAVGQLTIGEGA